MDNNEVAVTTLGTWLDAHPKTTFFSRLVLWFICAAGLPFAFIAWRFDLFTRVSAIQISGWGIVGIVIVALVILSAIKYIKIAMNAKYTLLGQILGGFCKVILPLIVFLLILKGLRDNIDMMIQVTGCVILCEAVAIPINPLPKWAYEMQKDVRVEERKETMDYLLDGFFNRKDDSKKK